MSSRVLRKLQGDSDLAKVDPEEEDHILRPGRSGAEVGAGAIPKRQNINPFDLVRKSVNERDENHGN